MNNKQVGRAIVIAILIIVLAAVSIELYLISTRQVSVSNPSTMSGAANGPSVNSMAHTVGIAKTDNFDIENAAKAASSVANEYEKFGTGLSVYQGIGYNPKLGGPTNEKISIKEIEDRIGNDAKKIKWLKTKISVSSPTYYIYEDDGPSGDPHFEFYVKNKNNSSFEYKGSTPVGLEIPGNGFLYSMSRNNELFNAYRKYEVKDNGNGEIVEVDQPLMLVGIRTKVHSIIELHASTSTKEVVTTLKPGSFVNIVAFAQNISSPENEDFLVLTDEGVYGWVSVEESNASEQCVYDSETGEIHSVNSALDDICFLGD